MNVIEDLKAYVDGELSPERRTELDAAMEQDAQLLRELEEIRVLSRLIGDCVVQPEPVGLERTVALLEKRSRPSFFSRLFKEPVRFAWVWAVGVFLLVAVFFPVFAQNKDEALVAMDSAATADKSVASTPAADAGEERKVQGGATTFGLGSSTAADSPEHDQDLKPRESGGFAGKMNGTIAKAPERANHTEPFRMGTEGNVVGGQRGVPGRPLAQRVKESELAFARPLLIRTADLGIQVASVRGAQTEATNAAKTFAGYVEQSSSSMDAANVPQASLTLRVPERRFDDAMNRLRRLGKVVSESVTGQDVTAQVADTEARVKEMKAAQESYINMLAKAKHVDDALSVRDRLDNVRQELASLQAQANALRNQAAYSTITLSLTETREAPKPPEQPSWFETAWTGAADRATGVGHWLAEVGMNLVVLAPIWLPIVIGLWWFGRRRARL